MGVCVRARVCVCARARARVWGGGGGFLVDVVVLLRFSFYLFLLNLQAFVICHARVVICHVLSAAYKQDCCLSGCR